MIELGYHAAYYRQEDGWYFVDILDFPGAATQGRTLASARRMARDALQLMAECSLERGRPLPMPKPARRRKKADFFECIPLTIRVLTNKAI